MLNRIFTVDSVTLASTGTAVSSYVPYDQTTRKLPTQVVVKATGQGAYVRLSDDNSAATNADVLVQAGDHVVLSVQGRHWVSVLSDGASSTVNIGALSTGVWGDASTLNLNFVAGTLDSRITFTRASSATYFDSNGTLQSVGNDVPRFDYDPSTLAALGLLIEEQRANLITSSAVLPTPGVNVAITADVFSAPDGTTTGDQILDNAVSTEHYSDSPFTPTAATNYTFSAFIKNIGARSSPFACLRIAGDFGAFVFVNLSTFAITTGGANFVDASIQPINDGWYRVSVTGLSVGTAASVARIQVTNATSLNAYSGTGQGFAVWGRQLEEGTFPTSHIPTSGATATRNADRAQINTLSPWYNASASTIYAEFQSTLTSAARAINSFNDGTANNRFTTLASTSQFTAGRNTGGAGVLFTPVAANAPTAGVNKVALAVANLDVALCGNGGTVATAATYNVPTVTTLELGGQLTGAYLSGHIRRIAYYPRRLSNTELQTVTS